MSSYQRSRALRASSAHRRAGSGQPPRRRRRPLPSATSCTLAEAAGPGEAPGGTLELRWEAPEAPPSQRYIVQVSDDAGASWRTVAVGLAEPRTLPPDELTGDEVTVRLLATTGSGASRYAPTRCRCDSRDVRHAVHLHRQPQFRTQQPTHSARHYVRRTFVWLLSKRIASGGTRWLSIMLRIQGVFCSSRANAADHRNWRKWLSDVPSSVTKTGRRSSRTCYLPKYILLSSSMTSPMSMSTGSRAMERETSGVWTCGLVHPAQRRVYEAEPACGESRMSTSMRLNGCGLSQLSA